MRLDPTMSRGDMCDPLSADPLSGRSLSAFEDPPPEGPLEGALEGAMVGGSGGGISKLGECDTPASGGGLPTPEVAKFELDDVGGGEVAPSCRSICS